MRGIARWPMIKLWCGQPLESPPYTATWTLAPRPYPKKTTTPAPPPPPPPPCPPAPGKGCCTFNRVGFFLACQHLGVLVLEMSRTGYSASSFHNRTHTHTHTHTRRGPLRPHSPSFLSLLMLTFSLYKLKSWFALASSAENSLC